MPLNAERDDFNAYADEAIAVANEEAEFSLLGLTLIGLVWAAAIPIAFIQGGVL